MWSTPKGDTELVVASVASSRIAAISPPDMTRKSERPSVKLSAFGPASRQIS
jgi:hypothetical protein